VVWKAVRRDQSLEDQMIEDVAIQQIPQMLKKLCESSLMM
jgi:hypothetical protein